MSSLETKWLIILSLSLQKISCSSGSEPEPALQGVERLQHRAAVKPADGVAVLLCVPLGPPGLLRCAMLGPALQPEGTEK